MQDLPDILNWRRWDRRVTLSGQPTEDQLHQLAKAGVTHVINLGPHNHADALKDEAASLAALGLGYVYIPVDFSAPSETDYQQFCAAMDQLQTQTLHVHCIYNARVSAFFYRYACDGRDGTVDQAFALMDSIWRPGHVWARFIGDSARLTQAHLYAGEDY